MHDIREVEWPTGLVLAEAAREPAGETNEVYCCRGRFRGEPVGCYVKVATREGHSLANERAVLEALAGGPVPVPRVLGYRDAPSAMLAIETVPGRMIWDGIDPRRAAYDGRQAISLLRLYGRCLAAIHGLRLAWPAQRRLRLEALHSLDEPAPSAFAPLVAWLQDHRPAQRDEVFVHGDLNTASVIVQGGELSGVIDWEFAGRGWREFDLAWVLRARRAFLNTPAERVAILAGYQEAAPYDEDGLRWCEVLNYLHFARWSLPTEPSYSEFALRNARRLAGLPEAGTGSTGCPERAT